MTRRELAAELGISHGRIPAWQKRGMPCRKVFGRWYFDVDAIRAWAVQHVQRPETVAGTEGEDTSPTRADADLRKSVALAELRELELAKRRGQVVARTEIAEAVASAAFTLRKRIEALPAHIAAELEGRDAAAIERRLSAEIADVLRILAAAPYAEWPLLCDACASEEHVAPRDPEAA